MDTPKKRSIVSLAIAIIPAVILVTAFAIPLDPGAPPLGRLLFPGSGIWKVPDKYPGSEHHRVQDVKTGVTIIRDDRGIPHIYAENNDDIAFGLGYVHAQDRLFFMDLARRFARGQLSEVLGKQALGADMVSKTKLLEYHARKTWKELKESKEDKYQKVVCYFENYVRGVNHYVETHPGDLPVEFHLLDYNFKPWTGEDCMSIAYFMLEGGPWGYWDLDRFVVLNAFIEEFGPRRGHRYFIDLFGNPAKGKVSPYQVPVNPGYGDYPDIRVQGNKVMKLSGVQDVTAHLPRVADACGKMLENIQVHPVERYRMLLDNMGGSNSWAVHGNKTASGKPLACADSHEPWQLPNIYYEAHVVNTKDDYNFYGYYVAGGAGIPVDGHNSHITWGMTVCQWDQLDWYYYDRVDENHYILDGKKKQFEEPITFKIKVKGQDAVEYTVNRTVHGPVFSDLGKHAPKAFKNLPESMDNLVIAARWLSHTSPKVKDVGPCLLGMSMARDIDEFREAMKNFEAPPNHITYADDRGNIFVYSMGGFPVRDNSGLPWWHLGNGIFPYNGSKGEGEWTKVVGYDEVPRTINPDRGFVVGANQVAAGPEYFKKYAAQYRYRPSYRARRINEVLAAGRGLKVSDMKALHTDILSIKARDLTPHFLDAMAKVKNKTDRQKEVEQLLSSWNFRMDKDQSAPSIFTAWREYTYHGTFGDQWAKMKLSDRLQPMDSMLEKLIRTEPHSQWFDDVNTPAKRETSNDVMLSSLEKALASLEDFFGTSDMTAWKWGSLHKLEFVHMTEIKAFNYGPVPISGALDTVWAPKNELLQNGTFDPTNATRGAHHRMIVDFGNLANCLSVLPGGNSGSTTSQAPFNQFDLYIGGEYHSEYFTALTPDQLNKQCDDVTSTITIMPEEE